MGVADHVGDGLFGGEKHIVPHLRRDGCRGKLGRHVEPVAQPRHREILLRILAHVGDQSVQSIVGRVNGPDDLIKGASGVEGSLGNLPGMSFDFLGVVFVALEQFAQQGDLREVGAELIVDVAGDAGALLLEGLLLSEGFELAVQLLRGNKMDNPDDHPQNGEGRRR